MKKKILTKNQKIGDAKLTGEVMLPGNAYYDKEGKFLGYYGYNLFRIRFGVMPKNSLLN